MNKQELEEALHHRTMDEWGTYFSKWGKLIRDYQEVKKKRVEWYKTEKRKLNQT